MKYSSSVVVPAPAVRILPLINDLAQYPSWMPLIHSIEVDDEGVWKVELRAKVGVFARSKRIRMRRTQNTQTSIVFERDENDGRVHSPWTLSVDVAEQNEHTTVTMNLSYGGTLWTAGVLDRILASQVDAGKEGLLRLVQGE